MTKFIKLSLLIITLGLIQACTSSHLQPVTGADATSAMKPQPGKALVVFMRTSIVGGAIQASVYDDDQYISTVSAGTRIAYQATPGEHMFMVIGESADFMKATLTEGKTYYALVTPRIGLWKARFSFRPIHKDKPWSEIDEMVKDTDLMTPNADGHQWAKDNAQSIQDKKAEYLQKWLTKDKNAQAEATLYAEDGF